MKRCSKCKSDKSLAEFPKDRSKKSGFKASCKACEKLASRKYRDENPEKALATAKQYRARNQDKERARCTKYNKENPEVRAHHAALRRSKTKSATPQWLTEEQRGDIKKMYTLAKKFENLCGIKYHVDHIVPLAGDGVCGLHVPWNLQLLPASINIAKSNNY